MKIAIVSLGGKSSKAIAKSCRRYFSQVEELDIRQFEVHIAKKGVKVSYAKKRLGEFDCMYIRGSTKYSLLQRSITRALGSEVYIPFAPETFTLGHDKFLTILELQRSGVPIPLTFYAASSELAKKILSSDVKFPVVIKVPDGTHGKGVMIADSAKSGRTVIDALAQFGKSFLMQEFVKTKKTSDIRALVVGDEVVASYKRVAMRGESRANVHMGGAREVHVLTDVQREIALQSSRAINARICGVDILNARVPSVIEINLSPSTHSIKEVSSVNVNQKIAKFLCNETKYFLEEKNKHYGALSKLVKKFFNRAREYW